MSACLSSTPLDPFAFQVDHMAFITPGRCRARLEDAKMISVIQFVPKSALGRRLMEHRIEVLEVATRHGASNLRVFGSVARGDDGPTSDIDLLVDLDDPTNLINVIGLECDLEDVLGIKVDVGALESLRTPLREEVMSEARAL